jgi:GT2 family glycosyltransferase
VGSSERPDVAVVVPTYQRPENLRRLLAALAAQTVQEQQWELVIVDDGSDQTNAQTIDELAAHSSLPVRVLHTPTNAGPARARNLGWRSTSAPIVAFTDDDCVPRPDWLAAGLSVLQQSERIGVVQGQTLRPVNTDGYPYSPFTVIREVKTPSPWFEGCNLFFRREALDAGGGFDENVGWFCEETELGWRILERGWDRAWADDAVVEHDLTERPWLWHLRNHFLEGNIVRIAARHPSIRSMFWRPWAVKRENALFALALLGLLIGTRRRAGLLLALPYARMFPRPWDRDADIIAITHQVSVHAASLAGKAIAGLGERTLLL